LNVDIVVNGSELHVAVSEWPAIRVSIEGPEESEIDICIGRANTSPVPLRSLQVLVIFQKVAQILALDTLPVSVFAFRDENVIRVRKCPRTSIDLESTNTSRANLQDEVEVYQTR